MYSISERPSQFRIADAQNPKAGYTLIVSHVLKCSCTIS